MTRWGFRHGMPTDWRDGVVALLVLMPLPGVQNARRP